MKRNSKLVAAFVISVLAAGANTAHAQTWTAMPALTNGTGSPRPFWDNVSDDQMGGGGCNIGHVLTGVATTTSCDPVNTVPASWLPFAGTPVSTYFSLNGQLAMSFIFRPGLYDVRQLGGSNLGGIIAGAKNTAFGTYTVAGGAASAVALPTGQNFQQQMLFTEDWGFYITLNRPTGYGNVYSGNAADARQFAAFSYGAPNFTIGSGGAARVDLSLTDVMYLGLEDNGCTQLGPTCSSISDFDNNDIVFSVQLVPEPSTYLLMATGLLGLGIAARRRRNA